MGLRSWYHDIVNWMVPALVVNTLSIKGLWWREIDTPQDLADVRACFARYGVDGSRPLLPLGVEQRQQF